MADAINAALDVALGFLEAAEEDQSSGEADGTYEKDPAIWAKFEEHRATLADARCVVAAREERMDSAMRLLGTAKGLLDTLFGMLREASALPPAPPGPAQLVIVVKGGMVDDLYALGLPCDDVEVYLADRDDDDAVDSLTLHRAPKGHHTTTPAPLRIRCNVDDLSIQRLVSPVELVVGVDDAED